jgi:NADPH-dependent ferric siderophore reductase
VHRARTRGETAHALCAQLGELGFPEGEGFAWLAGEASEVRSVYRYLVEQRSFPVARIHVSGHWARGVANHDHHAPIELREP